MHLFHYKKLRAMIITGMIILFFTTCEKPERVAKINTLETSQENISYTSALLKCEVTDLGSAGIEEFGIEISKNASYQNSTVIPKDTIPAKGVFKINVISLDKDASYYYRAYVTVNSKSIYGLSLKVKTKASEIAKITAGTISNITLTSANLSGDVTSDGGEPVTKRGLCWGTTANPTITTCLDSTINGSGTGTFTGLIHGLTQGTQYFVRAYSINAKGTAYNSADVVFTTLAPSEAATLSANPVSNTTATLNGTVNPNNLTTTVTFEYGTTTSYGQTITASQSPLTGNSVTNVSAPLTGLTQGTQYHFRVKAVNSAGPVYGSDFTFTTLEPPVATTSSASSVANTTATLNGSVNAKNSSTTVTFEYGLTTAYGQTVNATPGTVTGNSPTSVNANISGLTQGTIYHFRVKASSAGGSFDGADLTFTTTQPPAAVTGTADNITTVSAMLHGTINALNSSTTVTFEYGPTTSYGTTVTATQSPVTGNTVTNVSATVSGLSPSTIYHFRVIGTSAGGSTGGDDNIFTTDTAPVNSVLDADGNLYNIVTIGNQKWIGENLKVTKYNDGSDISLVANGSSWSSLSTGAYCWFNNDLTTYKNIYGALYNSYSVQTKKLCPTGWRVPYDVDWKILESYLGMSQSELDIIGGNRGTDQGEQLKSSTLWNGSNTSGFSAVEAGVRYNTGIFGGTLYTHFWTADNYNPGNYLIRQLYAASGFVYRNYMNVNWGLSVRCIKSLPVAYDIKVNSKTYSSANLSATIIPDSEGNETSITVEYGTSTSYGNNVIASPSFVSGFDKNPVIFDISGLIPETLYHFRINLTSSSGVISSQDYTFTTLSAPLTDYDGNIYNSVSIGAQVWLKENLKTTHYNNGDLIGTTATPSTSISGESSPKYQWAPDGNESNVSIYGRLYTWFTVTDSRGVCPVGWHVPTESEWASMKSFLIANGYNYDGTTTGNKITKSLAATFYWQASGNTGAVGNTDYTEKRNATGFTALPAGTRDANGSYNSPGRMASWWTSTFNYYVYAFSHFMLSDYSDLVDWFDNSFYGFSVRCIKN